MTTRKLLKKEIAVLNLKYQRLLRARYHKFSQDEMKPESLKLLDEVLAMPHPQREAAFVIWARVSHMISAHHEHEVVTVR